jgi:outer membrane lipoprotein-sorting protein
MKHIKFLLAIALVGAFVISCKETPKTEEAAEEVIEAVEVDQVEVVNDSTVVEAVEVAIDTLAVAE